MANPYSGSNFDDFLAEEGILEEVSARALKRLLAMQVSEVMGATKISKLQWVENLHTTRTHLDRLQDRTSTNPGSLQSLA